MRRFSYYLREGFRNIFAHGFMSFAAILIMLSCLLLTGSVALVAYNINLNIIDLQKSSEIVAFVDESYSTREAQALENEFDAIENIDTITFQSRDEALESYRIELGEDAGILDSFDSTNNPLRHAYRITMKDPTQVDDTIAQIDAIDGVANIRADETVIARLIQVQHIFNILSIAMLIALAVIAIFIISNTVKLGMFARREEISIQKMVGATNWFIRWPFVIEGLVLGLVSAGLAYGAEYLVYGKLVEVAASIPSIEMLPFGQIYYLVLAAFCGAGLIFGVGGSVTSIRRFMNV